MRRTNLFGLVDFFCAINKIVVGTLNDQFFKNRYNEI